MKRIPGITFFLFFLTASSALAQPAVHLVWALPLDADKVPLGVPDPQSFYFRENGLLYRMYRSGELKEMPYDSISHRGGPFWQTWKNKLTGIVHDSLGELLPPVYDAVKEASDRSDCWAFTVSKYGMSAIVDAQNKLLLPWAGGYSNVQIFGDTVLEYKKGYSQEYLSKSGHVLKESAVKWLKKPEFKRIAADKYLYTYLKASQAVTDTFSAVEPFAFGAAAVCKGALWGYIREDGAWLIRPRFQLARSFDAAGHAIVKIKDNYGLIRRDGSFAIEPRFGFLKAFSDGLLEIRDGDLAGLCDTMGRMVVPPGPYKGFTVAGSNTVGAQRIKNTALFTINGQPIALDSVFECKGNPYGDVFLAIKERNALGERAGGLANSKGQWVVPPVLTGGVVFYRHFIILDAQVTDPGVFPDIQFDRGLRNMRLLLNRNGDALLNYAFSSFYLPNSDDPVAVFELEKRYGLVSARGQVLEPAYDEIKRLDHRWFYVRRGQQWGVVYWEVE